ncbi:hypothetical protein GDO86_020145, partial [Hymenochirus boettgeri]
MSVSSENTKVRRVLKSPSLYKLIKSVSNSGLSSSALLPTPLLQLKDFNEMRGPTCTCLRRVGPAQIKIFTCEYCNKVFKFKHSLQTHLRIHTKEKPYKCSLCNYASAIKANLSVHLRKHTGEKFTCEHCPFSCLSKGHLKVHIERVHKKIKQHCCFCKKKYSDVKNLLKHIKDAHDLSDVKVKETFDKLRLLTREGKGQLLYDCHVCERKFKNELERDRHMLVHGDKRPYACELCGHGATKFHSLELHVRKHPFVYVCALCLKKFVSTARLKTHIKESHSGEQEALVFNDSINQSFCLLEPGSDVQQEALGDAEKEIPSVNLPLESNTHFNKGPAPGQTPKDSLNVAEQGTLSALENKEPKAKSLSAVGPIITETHGKSIAPIVAEKENDLCSDHGIVANRNNHSGQVHNHVINDVSESVELVRVSENISPRDEEGNSTSRNASAIQELNNSKETAAFMVILNGLQKKQLNPGILQKIRKVYGELECEYCGKLFWYQVHYDLHIRTHTREHLYYCSQCNYSSITKNCLKRHVIQKHSSMSLKCPSEGCEYSNPDKYKLQSHIKTHTDLEKKTYSCPSCGKSFSDDRLIKSHIKTSHP